MYNLQQQRSDRTEYVVMFEIFLLGLHIFTSHDQDQCLLPSLWYSLIV